VPQTESVIRSQIGNSSFPPWPWYHNETAITRLICARFLKSLQTRNRESGAGGTLRARNPSLKNGTCLAIFSLADFPPGVQAMPRIQSSSDNNRTALDYLLYVMAAMVVLTFFFSAALWLSF
jgi:hypothetical protein